MATIKPAAAPGTADTAPASTNPPNPKSAPAATSSDGSGRARRERKPAQTVTMPAAQAKRIAKALQGYAKHLHGTGNTADARRFAEAASVLEIAAEYGDKATS